LNNPSLREVHIIGDGHIGDGVIHSQLASMKLLYELWTLEAGDDWVVPGVKGYLMTF
jgi:hypothetical protein